MNVALMPVCFLYLFTFHCAESEHMVNKTLPLIAPITQLGHITSVMTSMSLKSITNHKIWRKLFISFLISTSK